MVVDKCYLEVDNGIYIEVEFVCIVQSGYVINKTIHFGSHISTIGTEAVIKVPKDGASYLNVVDIKKLKFVKEKTVERKCD